MSINSEVPRLNASGQAVLGVISSLLVNGVVHPISTIQSCRMANNSFSSAQGMGLSQLYRGFWAICATDAAAFSAAYITNGALVDRATPLSASIAAGLVSAPIICIGEGLARNRQVNAMPYRQVFQRAIRPAGLTATALREIPFTIAVFCLSPLLQRQLLQRLTGDNHSASSEMVVQAVAGILAGAIAGFATSPVELIKTRVQTSDASQTIAQVVRSVAVEGGYRGFFRGGGMRTVYVGLAGAGMNFVNNSAPHYLPNALRNEE